MNKKIGLISSMVICFSVAVFLICFISSIVIGSAVAIFLICLIAALFNRISFTENLSYGVCAILSWGWVATAVVYSCYAKKRAFCRGKNRSLHGRDLFDNNQYCILYSIIDGAI